jgi:plasmid stability protein
MSCYQRRDSGGRADDVKAKLQKRAKHHGRNTEKEMRGILRKAAKEDGAPAWSWHHDRFAL